MKDDVIHTISFLIDIQVKTYFNILKWNEPSLENNI